MRGPSDGGIRLGQRGSVFGRKSGEYRVKILNQGLDGLDLSDRQKGDVARGGRQATRLEEHPLGGKTALVMAGEAVGRRGKDVRQANAPHGPKPTKRLDREAGGGVRRRARSEEALGGDKSEGRAEGGQGWTWGKDQGEGRRSERYRRVTEGRMREEEGRGDSGWGESMGRGGGGELGALAKGGRTLLPTTTSG